MGVLILAHYYQSLKHILHFTTTLPHAQNILPFFFSAKQRNLFQQTPLAQQEESRFLCQYFRQQFFHIHDQFLDLLLLELISSIISIPTTKIIEVDY